MVLNNFIFIYSKGILKLYQFYVLFSFLHISFIIPYLKGQ